MRLSEVERRETERQLWAILLLSKACRLLDQVDTAEAREVQAEINLWFKGKHGA